MQSLHGVEYRARHINAGSAGGMSLVMHNDRWSNVDQQNQKETPTDQNQEFFKEIKASNCEGDRIFQLRQTQEQGVYIVSADGAKAGVATNVQVSLDGAWMEDTIERLTKTVSQTEVSENEFSANFRRAENTVDEDLASGRTVATMFAIKGIGHCGCLHKV